MTEEEILKKQLEEEKLKDADDTLPSSENEAEVEVEDTPEEEHDVVELNSSSVPTVEQKEIANLNPVSPEEGAQGGDLTEASECSENIEDDGMTEEQKEVEKMLTQSQVDEIVGRTRTETRDKTKAETLRGVYDRYGVSDEGGLDETVGKSQKYDLLREDYDKVINELNDIKTKLAMYDSGIAPERYEDARLILTGKGLDVTAENIRAELATHPEWEKKLPTMEVPNEVEETFQKVDKEEPARRISVLGNEKLPEEHRGRTEKESALKWFH